MSLVTTIYLHQQNLGIAKPLRCINCGRLFMSVNRNILAITNTNGIPLIEIPLGVGYAEHKCRGCEMVYRILWQ